MDDRLQLLDLLARDSFRLGEFQLSSGGTSDYYVDCRTTTLSVPGALLTARVFLEELRQLDPVPDAVGGLTLGADPIVVGVAIESTRSGKPISGFLVRKAEKAHGMGRRIEGQVHAGMRVAIVDDVCTTAASTVQAIEAAWSEGLEVVAVRCLIEREEAGGRNNLNQLWRAHRGRPCPFQAIFGAQEVRAAHKELLRGGNSIAEAAL
ncbi:MAG TPA: orotate phosphoribosyltransferase [Terriglobales bacterium]|nr:orotate phosphoribosyltransferase [Terriglobales bacterium]